jgi:hypothetical protein
MRRAPALPAAVTAAAVFSLLAVPAATPRSDTATIDQPSQIRITDRERSYRRLDEGPQGKGPGDVEIAWQTLYNRRITTKAIGHSELFCTYLTKRSRHCTTTYFLPKGKIVVEGVIGSRLLYELPVTGGTGLYANARGSVVVTSQSMHPRREILLFRLLP